MPLAVKVADLSKNNSKPQKVHYLNTTTTTDKKSFQNRNTLCRNVRSSALKSKSCSLKSVSCDLIANNYGK